MIQSAEMRESNALYKKHLEILTASGADNKVHQQELISIQKAQRKNEIMPRFTFRSASPKGVNLHLDLQLVRNIAYLEEVRNEDGAAIFFHMEITRRPIGTNETIHLTGSLNRTTTDISEFFRKAGFKFELLFRNEDKNLYRQVISGTGDKCEISPPVEVPETV